MRVCYFACLLPSLLAGCQKAEQPSSEQSKPVEVTPAAAAMSEEDILRSDIPVPEDFEEEAFAQIDEDNLEEQLAALEREIGADGE